MNFLKKKLKPFASGLTSAAASAGHQSQQQQNKQNLEDDLYDEYIVEAPPHPSELLALGVDPSEVDVNDPEKLKELYRKAKAGGKDKQTNSVLLAKQRQKEEIEEKKKTREEWKFFDSLTARVEQAVKDTQKTLDTLKESSAVNKLTEPEYELRQTPDEVFRPQTTVKQEKGADDWIDFGDEDTNSKKNKKEQKIIEGEDVGQLDEFGCQRRKSSAAVAAQNFVVEELLEDFGLDLRTAEQRKARAEEEEKKKKEKLEEEKRIKQQIEQQKANELKKQAIGQKSGIDLKAVARPRPRPTAAGNNTINHNNTKAQDSAKSAADLEPTKKGVEGVDAEVDPFDTSFIANQNQDLLPDDPHNNNKLEVSDRTDNSASKQQPRVVDDPFDTSYINL